jgi:tetratricopeptide (TPR) repeat protein
VEEAKRLVRQYETAVPAGLRRLNFFGYGAMGALAEAEGRDEEALAAYRRWVETDGACGVCGLYEIATIYDRRGQADSALAAYERLAGHSDDGIGHAVRAVQAGADVQAAGRAVRSKG